MNSQLRLISSAALALFLAPALHAKMPQQLASPDQVPEGLAKSDWHSIRAAYEAGRHTVHRQDNGNLSARNPGQQWNMEFDGKGFTVTPDHGAWVWGLELTGYGERTLLSDSSPIAQQAGKITCQRDEDLTEWFINDTRGLEQGWTFHQRPEHVAPATPLHLHFFVRGDLSPKIFPDGSSVNFEQKAGGSALIYGGLKAWDAEGKSLLVRFEQAEENCLSIAIDEQNARYPITIDPIAQQAYLKASNTGKGDKFGTSVSISGDTVVVGAPYEGGFSSGVNGNQTNDRNLDTGAVYVFVRNGAAWSQQAYVKSVDPIQYDFFGTSVAISGNTMVVGAPGRNNDFGAVFLFTRTGTTWTQRAELVSYGIQEFRNESYGGFGELLAISDELSAVDSQGVTTLYRNLVVGDSSGGGWDAGLYLYEIQGDIGIPKLRMVSPRYSSFAVSENTLVVGNPRQTSPGRAGTYIEGVGAVNVYEPVNNVWTLTATLVASNKGKGDYFGSSVAISGNTIVVSAEYEDSATTGVNGDQSNNQNVDSGAAYVFERQAGQWMQQAYLKPSNTKQCYGFGNSVAIAGDAIVVGAANESNSAIGINGPQGDDSDEFYGPNSGAAYVFNRSGPNWSQVAYLKSSYMGLSGDLFGSSVSISGDHVVIGVPGENNKATGVNANQAHNDDSLNSGAAYVFDLNSNAPSRPDIDIRQAGRSLPNAGTAERSFGSVEVGKTGKTMSFTIKNSGSVNLAGLSIVKSGSDAAAFDVVGPLAKSLAPGASTTFAVTFDPWAGWDFEAIIRVLSNADPESPFDINLTGQGFSPAIRVEQPKGSGLRDNRWEKSFGTINVGQKGATKVFTVKNVGNLKLTGLKISKDGKHAKDFIVSAPAKTSLAPGASTTFTVNFKPAAKGARKAAIHIKGNGANEDSFDINLTGLGAAP